MTHRRITAQVILCVLLPFCVAMAGSSFDEKACLSADEIAASWRNLLSDGLILVTHHPTLPYWYCHKLLLVKNAFTFNAERDSSTGTAYRLDIRFSHNRCENRFSPKANSDHDLQHRRIGFRSADAALARIDDSNFQKADYEVEEKISRQMIIAYVLSKNAWILEGGNDAFQAFIGQHIAEPHNAPLFKDVLTVPIN